LPFAFLDTQEHPLAVDDHAQRDDHGKRPELMRKMSHVPVARTLSLCGAAPALRTVSVAARVIGDLRMAAKKRRCDTVQWLT
jgi:hypothetical protein